jgi:perosamine synthetase
MTDKLILTAGPSITSKEIDYVTDAVTNGWNESWNSYICRFESTFSDYIALDYAISTSSATGALHLSLLSLGISHGDEVIVPELSWVASASSVTYVGATPVFCDVDPHTWCIDPSQIEKHITSKTKAIMPVHLYGHPAEMNEILRIAKKHNLYIIEDAAPAIGSYIYNMPAGSFGDISCFSFQGAKILSSGEGGVVATNSIDVYNKVKLYGDHGRDPSGKFLATQIGYKYKMSNLQAAMALAQLERLEELVSKKRQIYEWYSEELASLSLIQLSTEADNCRCNHWMTSFEILDTAAFPRDIIRAKMLDAFVDTRPVFPPLSSLPMFNTDEKNTNAYRIGFNSINLPSGHNLDRETVSYICTTLKSIFGCE